MSDDHGARRQPGAGWTLGAGGLPRSVWAGMAFIFAVLGVVLLVSGYIGYGALMLVVAAAAGVNVP
ncbi:MAG: hypothetical protein U0237_00885 [Thermoleophilia bacterium]